MLGCLSLWNGQTAMPFLFTFNPYRSAACLVVTDCFTASNKCNRSLLEMKNAPVIPELKMAGA